MFKTRLLSGIVLVAVLLFIVILGGDFLLVFLAAVSVIGMTEIYKCKDIHKNLIGYGGYVCAVLYYLALRFGNELHIMAAVIGTVIILLALYVITFPKYNSDQIFIGFFGVIYVAVMLSYIYRTRMLSDGAFVVWLIILASWGCDVSAYLIGRKYGKHKLSPILSPKKSVEGAIGGIFGAALAGFIYALLINVFSVSALWDKLWIYPLICAVGAVISQFGDLAASGIKRNHDIKDFGKLIPGHGGIIDRFDSVIFVSPVIFYMALIMHL